MPTPGERLRQPVVLAAALGAGLFLAYEDTRTDDTGILAGLIALATLALALYLPRRDLLIAGLVALPLVLHDVIGSGNTGTLLALVFALGGVGVARAARALVHRS